LQLKKKEKEQEQIIKDLDLQLQEQKSHAKRVQETNKTLVCKVKDLE